MKKYNIIKCGIMSGVLAITIVSSGCSKDVECNIDFEHVHKYTNQDGISKYIQGEKDHVFSYQRQDEYKKMDDNLKIICNKDLCDISDNKEYFLNYVNKVQPSREEYKGEYVYGLYTGYAYDYNPLTEKYEYFYGNHTGYHYEKTWEHISLDEYTRNPVRDITYKIKLYRVCEGEANFRYFDSIDDIDENYKYFKDGELIIKQISETYYLNYKYQKDENYKLN